MIRVHELPVSENETVTVTDCVCDWCGQAARIKGDHRSFEAFRNELNWVQIVKPPTEEDPVEERHAFCSNKCHYEWLRAEIDIAELVDAGVLNERG